MWPMRRILIMAATLAGLITVLWILVVEGNATLLAIDGTLGRALRYDGGSSTKIDILQVLTSPGLTVFRLVVLAPVVIVLAVRGQERMLGVVLLAGVSVGPLTALLKVLAGRVRPTADDPLVAADGLSFPSGHASGAAALVGILLVVLWPILTSRSRPWMASGLIVGALCVAWTRVALGVHYLSDVVGGLALGATVVLVSMALFGLYPGGPADQSGRPPDRLAATTSPLIRPTGHTRPDGQST